MKAEAGKGGKLSITTDEKNSLSELLSHLYFRTSALSLRMQDIFYSLKMFEKLRTESGRLIEAVRLTVVSSGSQVHDLEPSKKRLKDELERMLGGFKGSEEQMKAWHKRIHQMRMKMVELIVALEDKWWPSGAPTPAFLNDANMDNIKNLKDTLRKSRRNDKRKYQKLESAALREMLDALKMKSDRVGSVMLHTEIDGRTLANELMKLGKTSTWGNCAKEDRFDFYSSTRYNFVPLDLGNLVNQMQACRLGLACIPGKKTLRQMLCAGMPAMVNMWRNGNWEAGLVFWEMLSPCGRCEECLREVPFTPADLQTPNEQRQLKHAINKADIKRTRCLFERQAKLDFGLARLLLYRHDWDAGQEKYFDEHHPCVDPLRFSKQGLRETKLETEQFRDRDLIVTQHFDPKNTLKEWTDQGADVKAILDGRGGRLIHYFAEHICSYIIPSYISKAKYMDAYMRNHFNVEMWRELFKVVDIDVRDAHGRTPLAWMAKASHGNVALAFQSVLAAGAEIGAVDSNGYTPLHHLLDRPEEAHVMVDKPDAEDQSIVPHVLAAGVAEVLKVMIDCGADVNKPIAAKEGSMTPLQLACNTLPSSPHVGCAVVQLLIDSKANLNAGSVSESPLSSCIRHKKDGMTMLLIENGAKLGDDTKTARELMGAAAKAGNVKSMEKLIELVNTSTMSKEDKEKLLRNVIFVACTKGHSKIVIRLLKAYDALGENSNQLKTQLMLGGMGMKNGWQPMLESVIAAGIDLDKQVLVPDPKLKNKRTMTFFLHEAIHRRLDDVATFLIKKGASIHSVVPRKDPAHRVTIKYTPLMLATEYGAVEVAKELLLRGADPYPTTARRQSALEIAICALDMAIPKRDLGQVFCAFGMYETLLKHAKVDIKFGRDGANRASKMVSRLLRILYEAQNWPDSDFAVNIERLLRLTIEKGGIVEGDIDGDITAMHVCAKFGYVGIAKLLIENGRGVDSCALKSDIVNPDNMEVLITPIALAVVYGVQTFEMLTLLLETVPDPAKVVNRVDHLIVLQEKSQKNLISIAASNGNFPALKVLISCGAKIDQAILTRGRPAETPLMLAALNGHPLCVSELLKQGANVNAIYPERHGDGLYYKATALDMAVEENNEEVVEMLIEHGAKLGADATGHTLHSALGKEKTSIVRRLLQSGAAVSQLNRIDEDLKVTPLQIAVAKKQVEMVDLLLSNEEVEIDARDLKHGGTALHTAVELRDADPEFIIGMIRRLVAKGADINAARTQDKSTPLHSAVVCGSEEVVSEIIKQGGNVNSRYKGRDNNMMTPLDVAVNEGWHKIVKVLLEFGKVPYDSIGQDKVGNTLLLTAAYRGHVGVIHELLKFAYPCTSSRTVGDETVSVQTILPPNGETKMIDVQNRLGCNARNAAKNAKQTLVIEYLTGFVQLCVAVRNFNKNNSIEIETKDMRDNLGLVASLQKTDPQITSAQKKLEALADKWQKKFPSEKKSAATSSEDIQSLMAQASGPRDLSTYEEKKAAEKEEREMRPIFDGIMRASEIRMDKGSMMLKKERYLQAQACFTRAVAELETAERRMREVYSDKKRKNPAVGEPIDHPKWGRMQVQAILEKTAAYGSRSQARMLLAGRSIPESAHRLLESAVSDCEIVLADGEYMKRKVGPNVGQNKEQLQDISRQKWSEYMYHLKEIKARRDEAKSLLAELDARARDEDGASSSKHKEEDASKKAMAKLIEAEERERSLAQRKKEKNRSKKQRRRRQKQQPQAPALEGDREDNDESEDGGSTSRSRVIDTPDDGAGGDDSEGDRVERNGAEGNDGGSATPTEETVLPPYPVLMGADLARLKGSHHCFNADEQYCSVCFDLWGTKLVTVFPSCYHAICVACVQSLPAPNCPLCQSELSGLNMGDMLDTVRAEDAELMHLAAQLEVGGEGAAVDGIVNDLIVDLGFDLQKVKDQLERLLLGETDARLLRAKELTSDEKEDIHQKAMDPVRKLEKQLDVTNEKLSDLMDIESSETRRLYRRQAELRSHLSLARRAAQNEIYHRINAGQMDMGHQGGGKEEVKIDWHALTARGAKDQFNERIPHVLPVLKSVVLICGRGTHGKGGSKGSVLRDVICELIDERYSHVMEWGEVTGNPGALRVSWTGKLSAAAGREMRT